MGDDDGSLLFIGERRLARVWYEKTPRLIPDTALQELVIVYQIHQVCD